MHKEIFLFLPTNFCKLLRVFLILFGDSNTIDVFTSLDKVSRFQGTVLANELIVDTNNRITESVLLKLKSLQLESERRLGYEKAADKFREYLGAFFVVSILLFYFFLSFTFIGMSILRIQNFYY